MFFHDYLPEPIIFSLGAWQFHWYGLLLGLGIISGYALVLRTARRTVITRLLLDNLFIWLVVVGFIGARLLDVFGFEWFYFKDHLGEIWQVWRGGLTIYGALLGGVLVLYWWGKKHNIKLLTLTDLLLPGVALGQAIGRWGNYFNQELFGKPTSLPWGIPIAEINRPTLYQNFAYFHPTFLYESLGLFLLTVGLVFLYKKKKEGLLTAVYLLMAGLLRFGLEFLRIDEQQYILGARSGMVISALEMAAGLIIFIFLCSYVAKFYQRDTRT